MSLESRKPEAPAENVPEQPNYSPPVDFLSLVDPTADSSKSGSTTGTGAQGDRSISDSVKAALPSATVTSDTISFGQPGGNDQGVPKLTKKHAEGDRDKVPASANKTGSDPTLPLVLSREKTNTDTRPVQSILPAGDGAGCSVWASPPAAGGERDKLDAETLAKTVKTVHDSMNTLGGLGFDMKQFDETMGSLSSAQRKQVEEAWNAEYGKTNRQGQPETMRDALSRKLGGSESATFQHAINALDRPDKGVDAAGQLREMLLDRSKYFTMRSASENEKGMVDLLSGLTEQQLKDLDSDYKSRFGTGALDAIKAPSYISDKTKNDAEYFFKHGADQRSLEDVTKALAEANSASAVEDVLNHMSPDAREKVSNLRRFYAKAANERDEDSYDYSKDTGHIAYKDFAAAFDKVAQRFHPDDKMEQARWADMAEKKGGGLITALVDMRRNTFVDAFDVNKTIRAHVTPPGFSGYPTGEAARLRSEPNKSTIRNVLDAFAGSTTLRTGLSKSEIADVKNTLDWQTGIR